MSMSMPRKVAPLPPAKLHSDLCHKGHSVNKTGSISSTRSIGSAESEPRGDVENEKRRSADVKGKVRKSLSVETLRLRPDPGSTCGTE
jgi:hypothetical protein